MNQVSVILPTYNRANLIGRSARSVLQQTNCLGELIIVDDGSTDSTAEVIQSLPEKQRILYHRTSHRGVSAARNTGLELAGYDLIAFLDSDDHWLPHKLETQVNALRRNPDYLLSHTEEKWLRRGEHLNKKKIHHPRHGYIFPHCLQLCAVGMSTAMMPRHVVLDVGGFDTSLPCCEDYDLWLRLSAKHLFYLVEEALTVKEGGRPDQLSAIHRVGMDKYRIKALRKLIAEQNLDSEQFRLAVEELDKKCRIYGEGCIKHGRKNEGQRYLALAEHYTNHIGGGENGSD